MKKFSYLFTSIVLLIIAIAWNFYVAKFFSSFYQIDEWGIYLFSVPIAYCIVQFFSKPNQSSLKIIIAVFIGGLISILLSRTFDFLLLKTLMVLIGTIITWILTHIAAKTTKNVKK